MQSALKKTQLFMVKAELQREKNREKGLPLAHSSTDARTRAGLGVEQPVKTPVIHSEVSPAPDSSMPLMHNAPNAIVAPGIGFLDPHRKSGLSFRSWL